MKHIRYRNIKNKPRQLCVITATHQEINSKPNLRKAATALLQEDETNLRTLTGTGTKERGKDKYGVTTHIWYITYMCLIGFRIC